MAAAVKILKQLDTMKVVIVAAAHNNYYRAPPRDHEVEEGDNVQGDYPMTWLLPDSRELPNLIMVGSTDQNTFVARYSPYSTFITAWAPGANIRMVGLDPHPEWDSGNSFGSYIILRHSPFGSAMLTGYVIGISSHPFVTGLVAYLRGLLQNGPKIWRSRGM